MTADMLHLRHDRLDKSAGGFPSVSSTGLDKPDMDYQGYQAPAEVAKAQRSSSISTTNEIADVYLERHSAPALCDPWLGLSYKLIRGASAQVVPRSSHDCFTELIGSIKLTLTG
jgi:hypothetical protein